MIEKMRLNFLFPGSLPFLHLSFFWPTLQFFSYLSILMLKESTEFLISVIQFLRILEFFFFWNLMSLFIVSVSWQNGRAWLLCPWTQHNFYSLYPINPIPEASIYLFPLSAVSADHGLRCFIPCVLSNLWLCTAHCAFKSIQVTIPYGDGAPRLNSPISYLLGSREEKSLHGTALGIEVCSLTDGGLTDRRHHHSVSCTAMEWWYKYGRQMIDHSREGWWRAGCCCWVSNSDMHALLS